MSWKHWDLAGWNQALLHEIFFDGTRLSLPLTRICASDNLLAQCTADQQPDHDAVRRAFIDSFGSTAHEVVKKFSWDRAAQQSAEGLGEPNYFAALFLTLLAATAEDTTHEFGDYRTRFSTLVLPVVLNSPPVKNLSKMWEHLRDWSVRRARRHGDCRVLQLPAKNHERIIGYSKRLVFPAYRDGLRLAEILAKLRVNTNPEFWRLRHAIQRERTIFSNSFLAEFDIFGRSIDCADNDGAFNSAFWGAVCELVWETTLKEERQAGKYCLGIDMSDPGIPEFYLLADGTGAHRVTGAKSKLTLWFGGDYNYQLTHPSGTPWTMPALANAGRNSVGLARSKLWKSIGLGCAVFFRDSLGRMANIGVHDDGADACISLRSDLARDFAAQLPIGTRPILADGPGEWTLFLLLKVSSASLDRAIQSLPPAVREAIGFGWRPPRPTFSGAAWFGSALLVNPASDPIVQMAGATAGDFSMESGVVVRGNLELCGDEFRLPRNALLETEACERLHVSLLDAQGHRRDATVSIISSAPLGEMKFPALDRNWLCDGRGGALGDMEGDDAASVDAPLVAAIGAAVPCFIRDDGEFGLQVSDEGSEVLCRPFDWLAEALALRFQRCANISFAELMKHLEPASIAAAAKPWAVRRLLLSAGWIVSLERVGSSATSFAAGSRSISIYSIGVRVVARIVGMLSRAERRTLAMALLPGETMRHLGAPGMSLGALELHLLHTARVGEIAAPFKFDVIDKISFGPPLVTTLPAALPAGRAWPSEGNLCRWDSGQMKWISLTGGEPRGLGTLVRVASFYRNKFWIDSGSSFWVTDSTVWAWILQLAALGEPIGRVTANGDCLFNRRLLGLPPSLCRWWLHWGGGSMSIAPGGSIVFSGRGGVDIWDDLSGWFEKDLGQNRTKLDLAVERRLFALRLRRRTHRLGNT